MVDFAIACKLFAEDSDNEDAESSIDTIEEIEGDEKTTTSELRLGLGEKVGQIKRLKAKLDSVCYCYSGEYVVDDLERGRSQAYQC